MNEHVQQTTGDNGLKEITPVSYQMLQYALPWTGLHRIGDQFLWTMLKIMLCNLNMSKMLIFLNETTNEHYIVTAGEASLHVEQVQTASMKFCLSMLQSTGAFRHVPNVPESPFEGDDMLPRDGSTRELWAMPVVYEGNKVGVLVAIQAKHAAPHSEDEVRGDMEEVMRHMQIQYREPDVQMIQIHRQNAQRD